MTLCMDKRGSQVENALLIIIDALRADRVGAYGSSNLTPCIDNLINEGEVFDHCYSCINATDSSMTTILTGLYPTRHGVLNHGSNITPDELEHVSSTRALPEIVDDSKTSIAIDFLKRWHQRGFDEYLDPDRESRSRARNSAADITEKLPNKIEYLLREVHSQVTTNDHVASVYPRGDISTDVLVDSIRETDDPWFGLLHYWDAHIPYTPTKRLSDGTVDQRHYDIGNISLDELLKPIEGSKWDEQLRNRLTGESDTVSDMLRKYDAGVRLIDEQVGKLIKFLKEIDEYDNTAIVITSDHGESLTEHEIFFEHHGLYDPTVHVPLIINAPGFEGREDRFVQHYDLVPTLLDLFGHDYETDRFDGVSLVPSSDGTRAIDRDAVYMEEGNTARKRAIRTKQYKYIKRISRNRGCRYCGVTHAPDRELYDISVDPAETENIADVRPEVAEQLEGQLESWISSLPNPTRGDRKFGGNAEVLGRLESMGYL